MSLSEESKFEIGQRIHSVSDSRRVGTVMYVGPVDGYSGTWVGVDWDNGDGKHDGTVKGVRYFRTSAEQSGSLVRPHTISKGVSLIEALARRYTGGTTKEEEDEMYVYSMRKKRVAIQLLGKDKVQEKFSRFEELEHASLAYLGVSSPGPPHAIHGVIPNLKNLDLTGNLLSQWKDVNSICEELPALEVLDLTNNRMSHDVSGISSIRNIRILVLNNCGITWKQVDVLKHSLPALEELHLMSNGLMRIEAEPHVASCSCVEGFEHLRILNLEDNLIGLWDEIMKFSQLKSLEQLRLSKNNFKSISYPAVCPHHDSVHGEPFKNLCCLLLGGNKIEDLASVDSLNHFPNLRDVRLSDNPIVDPAKGGIQRFVLIARLTNVTMLNGSEVSAKERKDAEIRYVHLVMANMQLDKQEEIREKHPRVDRLSSWVPLIFSSSLLDCPSLYVPSRGMMENRGSNPNLTVIRLEVYSKWVRLLRFFELKKLHGIDDEKQSSAIAGSQKMSSALMPITLKCIGASIKEKPPLTKKLPATTTVGKLMVLCISFFKLKAVKPRLFLQEEGRPTPLLLDDDMESLADLRLGSNGGTILVDEEV
ncbi:Tubulin-folding cofactor E [Nymphaea thermarum]|nr:Tubulin-folding cofactor E [Nymphaea thermarum]